jgi:hypothetical protein
MEALTIAHTLKLDQRKEDDTMATRQEDIARARVSERGFDATRLLRAGFSRTFAWFDTTVFGGSTPRHYRREGYPEIEIHQVMSGHRERFDPR